MKRILAYILAAMTMVAGTACDDDPVYAVPENNSAKVLSIKQVMPPHLLNDGSLVAVTYDDETQVYSINRISKDGTVTTTNLPCTFNNSPNTSHWLNISSNDANDIILEDYYYQDYYSTDRYVVCKINQAGEIVYSLEDTKKSNDNSYFPQSGASLPDGRYAALINTSDIGTYYTNYVIEIIDQNGVYSGSLSTNCKTYYRHRRSFALGDNIIFFCEVAIPQEEVYIVSTENGTTLTYYELANEYYIQNSSYSLCEYYSFKDHLYISEPNYNTRKTKVTRLNEQGKKDFSVILDMYHLYGVSEIDGKAIFAGINLPKDCERYVYSPSDVGIYMRPYLQDIKGCIVTMDASNGGNAETIDISYEGGILPYGVASDDNGGYYVYMTRIMPSEVNDVEWLFHDNIHIYHTDNLNKLQIER